VCYVLCVVMQRFASFSQKGQAFGYNHHPSSGPHT